MIATGTATFIGRFFFGPQPAFAVPQLAPIGMDASSAISLSRYALLGVVISVAAAGFVCGLHAAGLAGHGRDGTGVDRDGDRVDQAAGAGAEVTEAPGLPAATGDGRVGITLGAGVA